MTYTGEVKNGFIVLSNTLRLQEGSSIRVEVETLTKEGFVRGSSEAVHHAMEEISGSWAESADEMAEALEYLRKSKWDETRLELDTPELGS